MNIINNMLSLLRHVLKFLIKTTHRRHEEKHGNTAENALNNKLIQDMIEGRKERAAFNQAVTRQINAMAAVTEQVAVTLAISNAILAKKGGIAETGEN
ncbi:MAG: hypothetical protein RXO22_05615 [Thermocladium sp.]